MNTYELNFLSKAINNENNENNKELDKDSIIAEKDDVINNELISRANSYNHALDECRSKNIEFYKLIQKKYF